MELKHDYIIAGSGLSGLSLLYRLLFDKNLNKKNILVIDSAVKTQNDRTWCFWEKEIGPFESLVCHQWRTLRFFSPQVSKEFEMKDYRYKMIQSADFYPFVLDFASRFENVTFLREQIVEIVEKGQKALVKTDAGTYTADYVFNSTGLFHPQMTEQNTLLQHFLGWYIRTGEPKFNPSVGTLMDFTLAQTHGTTFMYMLPTSTTEALVEYTLFSESVLTEQEYQAALEAYIQDKLGISDYTISHTEFGVIPMSLAKFSPYIGNNKRIINIGTAGGYTKPSTGYTFQFVQKHIGQIVNQLKQQESPVVKPSFRGNMFQWYDRTLLDVLLTKGLSGEQIFSSLFKRVDPERILAFLANESGFWEEFKIRNSVPIIPFMFSGIKQLMGLGRK